MKIFVYGTLKIGGRFHSEFKNDLINSEPAMLPNHALYDFDAYPGVVAKEKAITIGELHEYDSKAFPYIKERMDMIEGISIGLYSCSKLSVMLKDGTTKLAYVYLFNRNLNGFKPIPSGIWKL